MDAPVSAGLDRLRERLDRIYAGNPENDPVDRTFSDVVLRHEVPKTLPLALLEGFEWDVVGRRYQTMSDTYAYSARLVTLWSRTPSRMAASNKSVTRTKPNSRFRSTRSLP